MKIRGVKKQYHGKTVVDSVSFEIQKGKVTALIGPNGAGKSTVMSILSRLIAKDEGVVEFEGKKLEHWKSKELSKHLAILTQSNHIEMKTGFWMNCPEDSGREHTSPWSLRRIRSMSFWMNRRIIWIFIMLRI